MPTTHHILTPPASERVTVYTVRCWEFAPINEAEVAWTTVFVGAPADTNVISREAARKVWRKFKARGAKAHKETRVTAAELRAGDRFLNGGTTHTVVETYTSGLGYACLHTVKEDGSLRQFAERASASVVLLSGS